MKNKSQRHKSTNTFKFQPFSERIDCIDVDVFHRVTHEYEVQTDEDYCYFYHAIQKWNVLNLTESFDAFKKDVQTYKIVTSIQCYQQKDHIVEILLKHLKYKNTLSLEPLLDIVVSVAKDLRKDFYPYYPQFLNVLFSLLNIKEPEVIEWTFTCLAYLFKILWRVLIKNIDIVFNALLPLLSDTKPYYVQNFAAESFAYVARKVKNKHEFLKLLLNAVESNNDGIVGCGKLLFEVMHGVNKQFHSCADTLLPFLFESLYDKDLSTTVFKSILIEIINNVMQKINAQKNDLLWKTAIAILENCLSNLTERLNVIEIVLELIVHTLHYHDGKMLKNPIPVVEIIMKLLSNDLPNVILVLIAKISVSLLTSKYIHLQQEHTCMIIKKMLHQPENIMLYFVKHVHTISSFEILILPNFLKHCADNNLTDKWLQALTKLILKKSPTSKNGINLDKWIKYPLECISKTDCLIIEDNLNKFITLNNDNVLRNIEKYFCACICLPHLNLNNTEVIIENFNNAMNILCKQIKENNSDCEVEMKKLLFLLNNTVECLIHLTNANEILLQHMFILMNTILSLSTNVSYINSLNTIDLYLTALSNNTNVITTENLILIHEVLLHNFASPYHEIRLLTAHILMLFEEKSVLESLQIPEDCNIFSMCYNIESIEPQVHTYREQIQYIEKLSFDKQQMKLCIGTRFDTVPLYYLCGALYINFKLLWEPIINAIVTHANGFETDKFWNIFVHELKIVVENMHNNKNVSTDNLHTDFDCLNQLFDSMHSFKYTPDFCNYRILLWKALALFPEIAESKTRDVSELLLNFIELEYRKTNVDSAITWNIKQKNLQDEESSYNDKNLSKNEDKSKINGKIALKLLINHLSVFTKIKSPKSMYKEPELYKLYLDFLSHKNQEVQKLALNCLMTYKFKYLLPYSQNLFNLIDDKNFKNELALFRVDQDTAIVQIEHREHVIPIVMKIVYSKMFAKTGLRTGGKSSGQLRRNLILRFLAGCREEELLKFIQMIFKYYSNYIESDVEYMVKKIVENVNLENFIPPKRLQSSLNLISVVFEKFGGLMGNDSLNYLLKILLIIGTTVKSAFMQISNVHVGYLTLLKNLRTDGIKIIGRFFEHFDKYPWTSNEINAVFDFFVWPYINKLSIEGIHTPTALLKLFTQWGSNPRYFTLLVKYYETNKNNYPLIHCMNLMLNEKSQYTVSTIIMEMIEKLLSLQVDDEDEELEILVDNILSISEEILSHLTLNDKLNYGSCILLPHVPSILIKIKRKLTSKTKNINRRELFILSRISELVWEADISDSILELLLPISLKKCYLNANEETISQSLTTINNLMQIINEPKKHLKSISPLFGSVSYPSCRRILCQILNKADNSAAELITELNAWDVKWLDQPDFQRRLDAFRKIQNMMKENLLDLNLGILLIYNCYYSIRNEKDLSLRENSSQCLKTVASFLIKKYQSNKDKEYILDTTLFNLLRNWLRNKNDDVRNECISVLGYLARESSEHHVILRDLNKLTNKDDLEVDFFENLMHLQLHRRARALLRFSKVFREEINAPHIRTLTQFILPLTTYYLCNDKYAGKNNLVDASIEVIETVCHFLPWHQYEALLKFYLNKLKNKVEFQRQLVRITVTILDAFHFDVTKAEIVTKEIFDDKNVNENVVTEDTEKVTKTNETDKEINDDENIVEEDKDNNEEDEAIDEVLEEVLGEDEEQEETNENIAKAYTKIIILCKSTATRVTRTIQVILLPQLHKALAEMTHHDSSHKINRKRTCIEREEEDLLRVPISLAVVKLLQRLPKEILDANLPGVFMKLCTFLKSQLDSVRRTARETLQKIMTALGPSYLSTLLSEIKPLLNRGFQVHVLVFTVHGVLSCLKEMYQPGDLDKILLTVVELCKADLFGALAEEKEVAKILTKVSEAKSTKSFDTFQILAQYITAKCLMDLIIPVKNVIMNSYSFKIVSKVQECLKHITLGLIDNTFISIDDLLKFAYGVASERIPELLPKDKAILSEKEKEKILRQKTDCFIIPKAPIGVFKKNSAKLSHKTNAHVLVEFGIRICYFLLKRDKLKNEEYKAYIDPFVIIFKNCLTSRHVKLSTLTLQTLSWVMKYDLPSMKENVKEISNEIFAILHKYASAGLSKGENFDLVIASFKAMAVLVRDVKYYTIETKQLKLLLLYAEQDLYNHDRQATAFALLRSIIARKLIVPEIDSVMMKVAELSITSALDHVRLQGRTVFHQFLMDYPLGKKLDNYVGFYTSQLDYELQFGRESALEMIHDLIRSFPMNVLNEFSGMFLITLGARLVNDEIPECKMKAAACIKTMLTKITKRNRDSLFDMIHLWLKEKKVSHRRMAAQLCGILVKVEMIKFENRIPGLMLTILSQFGLAEEDLKPGRYVLLKQIERDSVTENDRLKDHHLYQVLNMLLKICAHCPSFLKHKEIEILSNHIQTLLSYPHEWVRLAAAQFLGFVLSSIDIKHLADLLISNKDDDEGYLYSDPLNGIKSLTLDLCAQLQPGSVKSDLAEQVIKNLVFIAKVLQEVPLDVSNEKKINLLWLTKRMRKIVNNEVVETTTSTILRTEVFKWIAAVATTLEVNKIQEVLNHLLAPLVREMITTEESNAPLRQLAKEVGKLIRQKIGMELYSSTLSNIQQHLLVKRAERKRTRTQLAVTDPEKFAQKKIKLHEKKKEAKKRKIVQNKGVHKKAKKRKVVDLELDNDEIF